MDEPKTRNRLLLVDGDPTNLRVLDVSLRSAGFDVETATNGTEAWALLEGTVPDLIIADTNLKGLDGFELCLRLRRNPRGATIPLVFLSSDNTLEHRMRSLAAGASDYLVKPAYIKEILARVRSLLQRRDRDRLVSEPGVGGGGDRFTGDLGDITVIDLVQLMEGNGRSGMAHLRGPGATPAAVYFRHGKVVDAEVGRLSGIDALSRLLSWTAGSFDLEWKSIRRKDAIERSTQDLVLEGMRRLDEWNRLAGTLSDTKAVFEVDYRLLAERLAGIPDEVNSILRLCDGVRSLMKVVEDSPLPDVEALTALIRLRDEGIIYDVSAVPAAGRETPSSKLEGWLGSGPSAAPSPPELAKSGVSGRVGSVSGPVQQSFAERLEVEAQTQPPRQEVAVTHDPRSASGSARRQTAPGFGLSAIATPPSTGPVAAGLHSGVEPIPAARTADDNIIKFPAYGEPKISTAGPTGRTLIGTPAAVSVTPPAPATSPSPSSPSPTFPAPLTDTYRGLGPRPTLDASARDRTEREENGPAPGQVPISGGVVAPAVSALVVSAPVVSAPMSPAPPLETPPEIGEVEPPSDDPFNPRVGRAVEEVGEGTVRISFPDDDINRRDALDELGLPSRWRGMRILAAVLVVGALGTVGVQQFLNRRRTSGAAVPDSTGVAPTSPIPVQRPAGGEQALVPAGDPNSPTATLTPAARVGVPEVVPLPAVDLPKPDEVLAKASVASVVEGVARPGVGPSAGTASPTEEGHASAPGELQPTAADRHARAAVGDETLPIATKPAPPSAAGAPAIAAPSSPVAAHAASRPVGPPQSSPGRVTTRAETEAARPTTEEGASAFARQLAACRTAFARNRLHDALLACGAAVQANPNSPEALTMLAHTELNRGHLAQAGELAAKAVAVDPNIADAYVIIGGVNQDSGKNREAKTAYRRYLQLAPQGRYADELRSIVNAL